MPPQQGCLSKRLGAATVEMVHGTNQALCRQMKSMEPGNRDGVGRAVLCPLACRGIGANLVRLLSGGHRRRLGMDWKLEVVVISVSDVDRAKRFYSEQLGFNVDVDNRMGESFRNVQLTPGSACSVTSAPGSRQACRWSWGISRPLEPNWWRGVLRSARSSTLRTGVWVEGPGGPWNSFLFFKEPDGRDWAVQEQPMAA